MDYTIACESERPEFRRHFRGSLAMSIPSGKDTGCSEFIICLEPIHDRDSKVVDKDVVSGATVFGQVVSGMDVLSKVRQAVYAGPLSQPPVTEKIVEATVLRKRKHDYAVKKTEQKAKTDGAAKPATDTKTPLEGKTEGAKTPEKSDSGKTTP
jgi:cyclophilin family peptidyl-prolyl cis-trans isomerase